jgi:hypothetical protein
VKTLTNTRTTNENNNNNKMSLCRWRRLTTCSAVVVLVLFLSLVFLETSTDHGPLTSSGTTSSSTVDKKTTPLASNNTKQESTTATAAPTKAPTKAPTPEPPHKKLPSNFHFLHIPKTGSSIFRTLIEYQCNTTTGDEIQLIYRKVTMGSPRETCAQSLISGHGPLNSGQQQHGFLQRVFTLVRQPTSRIASGLVHNLHDCPRLTQKFKIDEHSNVAKTMTGFCQAVSTYHAQLLGTTNNTTTTTTTTPIRDYYNVWGQNLSIPALVSDYAQCVRGCGTNMLSGRPCGGTVHNKNVQPSAAVSHRIQQMAFVGVTDQWEETLCAFHHLFPRQNGQAYEELAVNTRLSPFKTCVHQVEDILQTLGTSNDDPDGELFRQGQARLQADLPPVCRDPVQRRRYLASLPFQTQLEL